MLVFEFMGAFALACGCMKVAPNVAKFGLKTYLKGTEASPVCDRKNLSSLTTFGKTNLEDMDVDSLMDLMLIENVAIG